MATIFTVQTQFIPQNVGKFVQLTDMLTWNLSHVHIFAEWLQSEGSADFFLIHSHVNSEEKFLETAGVQHILNSLP